MNVTKSFYQQQRQDDAFNKFYESVVKNANDLQIGEPMLPRYRKAPRRYDDGSHQFAFSDPRSYYRHKHFEACDLSAQELNDPFFQRDINQLLPWSRCIMKSANGDSCLQDLSDMKESIFNKDVCVHKLQYQLRMLVDGIRVELPEVKKVTSIRTICDAMAQHVNKNILSEVHLLLRLYLTIPITSIKHLRNEFFRT